MIYAPEPDGWADDIYVECSDCDWYGIANVQASSMELGAWTCPACGEEQDYANPNPFDEWREMEREGN